MIDSSTARKILAICTPKEKQEIVDLIEVAKRADQLQMEIKHKVKEIEVLVVSNSKLVDEGDEMKEQVANLMHQDEEQIHTLAAHKAQQIIEGWLGALNIQVTVNNSLLNRS